MTQTHVRSDKGWHQPPPQETPRLRLKPKGLPTGRVDGAWWPHSDDLAAEIPDLVAVLSVRLGQHQRRVVQDDRVGPPPGQDADRRPDGASLRLSPTARQHRRGARTRRPASGAAGGACRHRGARGARNLDGRRQPRTTPRRSTHCSRPRTRRPDSPSPPATGIPGAGLVDQDVRRGAPTAVVGFDVGGEGAQSAADEPGGSVGMPAGPATVDQPRHSPNLFHQWVIRAAEGQFVDQLGQPRQTLAGTGRTAARSRRRDTRRSPRCGPDRTRWRPARARCRRPGSPPAPSVPIATACVPPNVLAGSQLP